MKGKDFNMQYMHDLSPQGVLDTIENLYLYGRMAGGNEPIFVIEKTLLC